MSVQEIKFGLNHMSCPTLTPLDLVDVASKLDFQGIELRNDVRNNSIADMDTAKAVCDRAGLADIEVISVNALYPFNIWDDERKQQAEELARLANACGARALVCCPLVAADYSASAQERADQLHLALSELRPILKSYSLKGLIEPLGFPISSLRYKQDVAEAILALGTNGRFGLVHDTFHHCGAAEAKIYPEITGLIHVSGVEDPSISFDEMLDAHRLFLGPNDRLDSIGQIRQLLGAGFSGYVSFEPFADEIWEIEDPVPAIRACKNFIEAELRH